MNIESKYLEDRLISHENTFSTPSVSTLGAKFAEFVKDLEEYNGESSSLDQFARELMLYMFDATNAEKTNYGSDIVEYQALEENIEQQIKSSQKEILLLTEELSQQQQIRKHKEECEALAKSVNTFQSRSILNTEIDRMNESLRKLNDKVNSTESRIGLRSKQFLLLLQSISDLQTTLREDEELDKLTSQYESMENEEEMLVDDVDNDDTERGEDRGRSRGGDEPDSKKPRLDEGEGGGEQEGEEEGGEVTEEKPEEGDGVVEEGEVEEPGEVPESLPNTVDTAVASTV